MTRHIYWPNLTAQLLKSELVLESYNNIKKYASISKPQFFRWVPEDILKINNLIVLYNNAFAFNKLLHG